jgi:hypothetical protein
MPHIASMLFCHIYFLKISHEISLNVVIDAHVLINVNIVPLILLDHYVNLDLAYNYVT